jgi:aspartyl-tRNA(Asn)/glutamyl-tRNA(Gln) amidotransferase subunit C
MSIRIDEVRHVARLARLAIDETQGHAFAAELSSILGLVGQMSQRNTDGVEPMANPFDATQRLRPDAVTESDSRDQLQAGAPALEDGLYLVPRVID